MKRLFLTTAVAVALTGIVAPAALGFAANYDYAGHARGEPSESVGFFVDGAAGHGKKVAGFTVAQIPYTCTDAPSGTTTGWKFKPTMKVHHRVFQAKGDWTGLPLDPVGKVSGRFRRGGVATGDFKLRGELAGPGTHCKTGLLGWRATKQPPPA